MWNSVKAILWILAFLAIILGVTFGILRIWFVSVATVGHNAMAPTLVAGDKIAIWRNTEIALGDVVICVHPRYADRYVLGRVVGLPGAVLEADSGWLVVNGRRVLRNYDGMRRFNDVVRGRVETFSLATEEISIHTATIFIRKGDTMRLRKHTVKTGIYLLGDNRSHTNEDSRTFGEVDPATCLGTVFLRLAPAPPRGDEVETGHLEFIQ